MKICHVLWGLAYGGVETMIVNITAEQARHGHDVSIIVISDEVDDKFVESVSKDVKVFRIERRRGSKNPLQLLKLYAKLLSTRPDVIHLHAIQMSKFIPANMAPVVCATQHNDDIEGLDKFLGRGVELISISNAISSHLSKAYGYSSPVVTNGIIMSAFRQRQDWFAGGHTFRIVYVGRLEERLIKGQDILIRAAAKLISQGTDISVDLIGEGPARARFEQMITESGVGDKVRLLGAKSQEYLREHLADYDLFVQPSRKEGFGISAVEAMAALVPVLVSDVDALLEVTGNGKFGYSFESENPDALASEIAAIIANYDPKVTELAYENAYENYDVSSTARAYLDAYNELRKKHK